MVVREQAGAEWARMQAVKDLPEWDVATRVWVRVVVEVAPWEEVRLEVLQAQEEAQQVAHRGCPSKEARECSGKEPCEQMGQELVVAWEEVEVVVAAEARVVPMEAALIDSLLW